MLGQYDFPVLDPDAPARLLFVAPNLAQAANALDADADQLLRWVALHETTHALQFGGVDWLRPYLAETVTELLGALQVNPRALLRLPDVADLRRLFEQVREDGLATVVVGPQRRAQLDRVQAFMAVLEGYAEHVMDAVGAQVLEDLPSLRSALQRRRRDRSGLLKVLERLIGMDLKMRQYEQGKAFCDGVVARAGMDGLNHVWDGPEAMPSMQELDDPAGWLRTGRAAPAAQERVAFEPAFGSSQSLTPFTACSRGICWVPATKSAPRCNASRLRCKNICSDRAEDFLRGTTHG